MRGASSNHMHEAHSSHVPSQPRSPLANTSQSFWDEDLSCRYVALGFDTLDFLSSQLQEPNVEAPFVIHTPFQLWSVSACINLYTKLDRRTYVPETHYKPRCRVCILRTIIYHLSESSQLRKRTANLAGNNPFHIRAVLFAWWKSATGGNP